MVAHADNALLLTTAACAQQLLNLSIALFPIPARGTTVLARTVVHPVHSAAQPLHELAAGPPCNKSPAFAIALRSMFLRNFEASVFVRLQVPRLAQKAFGILD